jgi:hypothetical protein
VNGRHSDVVGENTKYCFEMAKDVAQIWKGKDGLRWNIEAKKGGCRNFIYSTAGQ